LPRSLPETLINDVFLERFLDGFSPVRPSLRDHTDWVRTAAEIRSSSPILCGAFQAVAATYFGKSVGDSRIVWAGQQKYGMVLRGLQRALCSQVESKSRDTLFTVVLMGHFEVLLPRQTRKMETNARGGTRVSNRPQKERCLIISSEL
jgi:hypothetical protein